MTYIKYIPTYTYIYIIYMYIHNIRTKYTESYLNFQLYTSNLEKQFIRRIHMAYTNQPHII